MLTTVKDRPGPSRVRDGDRPAVPAARRRSSSSADGARTRPAQARLCYPPREVAILLGIGRTKVYELIGSGRLDAISIGRARRITADSLHRFIQEQQ